MQNVSYLSMYVGINVSLYVHMYTVRTHACMYVHSVSTYHKWHVCTVLCAYEDCWAKRSTWWSLEEEVEKELLPGWHFLLSINFWPNFISKLQNYYLKTFTGWIKHLRTQYKMVSSDITWLIKIWDFLGFFFGWKSEFF